MDVQAQKPSGLLSVEEARSRILAAMPVLGPEAVPLGNALGRILVDDVVAAVSHPPLPVSSMDGYACRASDVASLPMRLRAIGVSKAGARFLGEVAPGTCVRIFTGAAVPAGADTIVLQEDATERDGMVEIAEAGKPGQFIRPAGMDFAAGQRCVERGRTLTARDLGLIASCGHGVVAVRRKPRVAILSTGDELLEPGMPPAAPDQITASNGIALAAAVSAWGGEPIDLGIAPDRVDAVAAAIDRASGADLLVTSGGASVGDHDLVQAALLTRGFAADFWKIAMRPGKPLMFGRLGTMPVLSMPGNPVSALVCALLFLRPALAAMLGAADTDLRFEHAVLAAAMPENDRREDYVRTRLVTEGDGHLMAHPYAAQDSGMALILAQADGLIRRAPFAPAARAGDAVDVLAFRNFGGY
jgi:molybdopterin molybdotransferase